MWSVSFIIKYFFLKASIAKHVFSERSKVRETRCHFESLSSSLDETLVKRAAAHRARPMEVTDARNALTAVGTCFAHTALDYVAQINIAHAHKDHTVLDAVSLL